MDPDSTVQTECISCRRELTPPKGAFICGVCEEWVCKNCVQIHDPVSFSFLKTVPVALLHIYYCGGCYDQEVMPERESYDEIMERAKSAFVFFKTQRKEIPLIKKAKEIYRVTDCPDRDETILRLAFFAAQAGYNAVIEVDEKSEKVRNGAYQTSKWSGTGVGAQVDGAKIDRQDLRNLMYR